MVSSASISIYIWVYMFLNTYIYFPIYMDTTTFWDYLTYVVNYCTLFFQTKLELDWLQDVFTLVLHGLRVSHFIHDFSQFLNSNQDTILSSTRHIFCFNDIKRVLCWRYHTPNGTANIMPTDCLVHPAASDHPLKIKDSIPFIYFVYIPSICFTPFSEKVAAQLLGNCATKLYNIWILTTSVCIVGRLDRVVPNTHFLVHRHLSQPLITMHGDVFSWEDILHCCFLMHVGFSWEDVLHCCFLMHVSVTVTGAPWCLKSPANRLCIQPLVIEIQQHRKLQSSTLLALCEGNALVTGWFLSQSNAKSVPCHDVIVSLWSFRKSGFAI